MRTLVHLLLAGLFLNLFSCNQEPDQVLVFTKTEGFRHGSIPAGIAAITELGDRHGFTVTATEDASLFTEEVLREHRAVIFLNTSGDVLNETQQIALRRFIQAGGGFVGIHGASTTEYRWPWFRQLVGAKFTDHPEIQEATIRVANADHPATAHLPETWTRTDEWYNLEDLYPGITPLLQLDESSYTGGTMGKDHPIAWYHEYDGGRAFYTALGHTEESYTEQAFLQHILGGIQYAIGDQPLDYSRETVMPEESRFEKVVLDYYLEEPMELELLPDGRLIFIERKGKLHIHDPKTGKTSLSAEMDVYTGQEDGLIGLTLDPNFAENNWIYLNYSDPEASEQHVSRFVYNPDADQSLSEEKLLLRIPTQRDECCHSGGSLEFGPDGNLFISAGDDTNPFASSGYAPIDGRPGRKPWDARRSSANTQDLRGKILRIKPEPDGTYSIPDGNLFPKDGSQGRPEIYVMGCRNPFRISIDPHTKYLYWGDVGPDANEDGVLRGPMGHDEVNQARGPGFFGWPLFVGNNYPYYAYDFATQTSGEPFDPQNPINDSPNNTGMRELPPAQPAFIYYPYRESDIFPLMNSGGRNAMAGPVYYYDEYEDNPRRYPKYYDKKFFSYDWMRGIMLVNTLDEQGNLLLMERFLPSIKWNNLVDIVMSPQGDMFMIEYGTGWFTANEDARLVHLQYTPGNRTPKARIKASKSVGGVPLAVDFNATESFDYDGDELSYSWDFGGGQTAQGPIVRHTFTEAAPYFVTLTVEDPSGEQDQAQIKIMAGNEPPQINWEVAGNQDFYWPGQQIEYRLQVADQEDGKVGAGINPNEVYRTLDYLEGGYDLTEIAQGHQIVAARISNEQGKALIDGSDCMSCHKLNGPSIGPSYLEVAGKYQDDDQAAAYLAGKIINGGSGVWGETAMAAHPDITPPKAEAMANYILGLAPKEGGTDLPLAGTVRLEVPADKNPDGVFVLMASYFDQGGNGMDPLQTQAAFSLRSPQILAGEHQRTDRASMDEIPVDATIQLRANTPVLQISPDGYAAFGPIDLTGVGGIEFRLDLDAARNQGGTLSIHLDDPDSAPIATVELSPTQDPDQAIQTLRAQFSALEGKHELILKGAGPGVPVVGLLSFTLQRAKKDDL